MTRPTKRSIPPASRSPRPTRRGVVAQEEPADEPFFSSRPTRRDVRAQTEDEAPAQRTKDPGPRGQFSIAAARGVPADVVSGTISPRPASHERTRRKTRNTVPPDEAYFVSATKKQITFVIQGRSVTLDRATAIELASKIFTTFTVSRED